VNRTWHGNTVRSSKSGAANATADRAIDILLLFSEQQPVWTMAQIAAHFAMPRTTTYRYVNSLRSYGLIAEDASGGYRLGPRIFPLARIAKASSSVLAIAAPHLAALNEKFGEAVILYERLGHEVIALQRNECRHRVSINYFRGQLLPWPATASAKVLLAHAPPDEQKAIMRLLEPVRYTTRTTRTLGELRKALAQILEQGYAYSDQERDEGVRGIAAPIVGREQTRHCVTLSGPVFRLTDRKVLEMIAAVKRAARMISQDLGKTEY
jgi:IclR family transcriptional regulator, KDG regulon repressor